MKPIPLFALASLFPTFHAHWVYPVISINDGPKSSIWQYIRKLGPAPPPYFSPNDPLRGQPHRDIYSDEIRCGRGAFASAGTTETAVVQAGDEISIYSYYAGRENNSTQTMYHPGAAQIYLSKSTTPDLASYKGDGEWFKIAHFGSSDGNHWDLVQKDSLSFKIPPTTPPGLYLLKTEYFAYHQRPQIDKFEFYLSCAQVEIKGPGGGTPGPTVKFPGAYDWFDRSIWRPHSMGYWGERPGDDYKNPGPEVWVG